MQQHTQSKGGEHEDCGLEILQVSVGYGNVLVLEDINLTVGRGELFALVGPSGSGKSTLLLSVAGFLPIRKGTISLAGRDISSVPPNGREIGMVFQSYTLFPHMTVLQNVTYSLVIRGQANEKIRQRAGELLELLQLKGLENRYPAQLSGGQQQRVALARALAFKPDLLLLDEPLGALDRKLRVELQSEIHRVQRAAETTTLYVTHDQKEAMAISDRIGVLCDGVVQQIGTPREIYNNPANLFVADFFGGANFLTVRILGRRQDSCVVELSHKKIENVPCSRNLAESSTDGILMVRPESWLVGTQPCEQRVEIPGIVEEITFEGEAVALRCRMLNGPPITVRGLARDLAGLSANEVVYLGVSGSETRLFAQRG